MGTNFDLRGIFRKPHVHMYQIATLQTNYPLVAYVVPDRTRVDMAINLSNDNEF